MYIHPGRACSIHLTTHVSPLKLIFLPSGPPTLGWLFTLDIKASQLAIGYKGSAATKSGCIETSFSRETQNVISVKQRGFGFLLKRKKERKAGARWR